MIRLSRVVLVVASVWVTLFAEDSSSKAASIPLPPLMNGGIAGLWYREHQFLQSRYGDFELLNFDNAGFPVSADAVAGSNWKLVAMGNFVDEQSVQFATLARVAGQTQGLLLVMFAWTDPADSSKPHGVFHHAFVGQESLLIRTKQATDGWVDTLEFSCSDLGRVCGKAYYNTASGDISLAIVNMDRTSVPPPPEPVAPDEDGW